METLRVRRLGTTAINDYWKLGTTVYLDIPKYHNEFISQFGKLFRYGRSVLYGNFDGRSDSPAINPTIMARPDLDSPVSDLGSYTDVARYPSYTHLLTFNLFNGDSVSNSSNFRAYGAKRGNADYGNYRITNSTMYAYGYEPKEQLIYLDGIERGLFKVDNSSYLLNQSFVIRGTFYRIYKDGKLEVDATSGNESSMNTVNFREGSVYEIYSTANATDGSVLSFEYDSKPFRKYTRTKLIPDLPVSINSDTSEFLDLSRVANGRLTIPDVSMELDGALVDGNRVIDITSDTKLKFLNKNPLPNRSFCEYEILFNDFSPIVWRLESNVI